MRGNDVITARGAQDTGEGQNGHESHPTRQQRQVRPRSEHAGSPAETGITPPSFLTVGEAVGKRETAAGARRDGRR